jgi:hypothetical protein
MIAEQTSQGTTASSVHGCLLDFTSVKPVACTFGSPQSHRVFVLFGDSHADEWSSPLATIARRNDWRMVTFLKSSCAVADIPVYNMRLRRFSPECAAWRAAAIAAIGRLHPAAVVIAEFSGGYILGRQTALGPYAADHASWSAGLERTLTTFGKFHIPVILVRDSPTPGQNETNCLSRALWHGHSTNSCEPARSFALDDGVTVAEQRMTAGRADRNLIDLSDRICGKNRCPVLENGMVVYRDANHLTDVFASSFMPQFEAALSPLMTADVR